MANYTIESSFVVSVGTVTASSITVASLVGAGVPSGGTANQILEKINATDYNTQWVVKPTSNVSTDLSEGTSTETTVDVDSSDGTNATLVSASTSRAGLLTKAKWDEIVANTLKVSLDTDSVTQTKLATNFKGSSVISASEVDWDDEQVRTKTLGGNTVLTFANLYIGVKDLEITGNYTLGFPANFKVITGTYDGTVANLIEVICTDISTPAGWITISQEA